jgi:hypothetical protein
VPGKSGSRSTGKSRHTRLLVPAQQTTSASNAKPGKPGLPMVAPASFAAQGSIRHDLLGPWYDAGQKAAYGVEYLFGGTEAYAIAYGG